MRRLFWKIYLTLLASLVATITLMGAFFWFLGEAQREVGGPSAHAHGPADVSVYAADGALVGVRGRAITPADYGAEKNHWGPGRVLRLELPGGGFALTRLGPPMRARALRLLVFMMAIAGGVGVAAYPVTALLTRRLEALRAGVARWGDAGHLVRLDERGHDEVALLARTFNTTAGRLDALLAAQKALLANASHELRSPLARLRVAVEVGARDEGARQEGTREEVVRNLAEMDGLVDELLLSSRLDHPDQRADRSETIDLLGLAAEEAARYEANVGGAPVEIRGDPVLLRRLIRNLLENAARHGRPPIDVVVAPDAGGAAITVSDAGKGIAAADRERVFEPFYRPAGAGEAAGGWGLGLALVRQIAARHGGSAACLEAPGGGSRFVVRLGSGA